MTQVIDLAPSREAKKGESIARGWLFCVKFCEIMGVLGVRFVHVEENV